jgi:hypothetical protein
LTARRSDAERALRRHHVAQSKALEGTDWAALAIERLATCDPEACVRRDHPLIEARVLTHAFGYAVHPAHAKAAWLHARALGRAEIARDRARGIENRGKLVPDPIVDPGLFHNFVRMTCALGPDLAAIERQRRIADTCSRLANRARDLGVQPQVQPRTDRLARAVYALAPRWPVDLLLCDDLPRSAPGDELHDALGMLLSLAGRAAPDAFTSQIHHAIAEAMAPLLIARADGILCALEGMRDRARRP